MRRIRRAAVLAATAALVGAACTGDDGDGTADPGTAAPDFELASSLRPLDSCAALTDWLADEVAPRVGPYGLDGEVVSFGVDDAAEDAGIALEAEAGADPVPTDGEGGAREPDAAPGTPAAGAPDASTTNVQVEGVDEPDIVKTDGDRILAVAGGRLHLVSAGERRVLDAVDLPAGVHTADLLLAGDRALVVGAGDPFTFGDRPTAAGSDIAVVESAAVVTEVDLGDGSLRLGETYRLDGTYVSARMTGDSVRLVLRSSPADRLAFVSPANGTEAAAEAAREHNRRVVEDADPDDLLPRWHRLDDAGTAVDDGALVDCADVHAPATYAGFALVTVTSLDLGDGLAAGLADPGSAAVLAEGDTVYATAEHLYVAAPRWVDVRPVPLPEPLPVEPDGPATDEAPGGDEPGTDIHRFAVTDPGRASYELSGHVPGRLLNQFSLDEHGGHLRVATTVTPVGSPGADVTTDNRVTVLAPDDGGLTAVGSVGGLGRGETIQSVRFMGDVGYVVTFRQTDPLFTLDLSDPTSPRTTGELQMLGFSSYLHPVGDGRLLGVGQDATEQGVTTGTQVALFDVRDPAAPRRVDQVVLPDSWSTAEHDHHAFLWWPADGLAAIPLSSHGDPAFEGLVGFTVDPEAGTIAERGRVTHPTARLDPGVDPADLTPEERDALLAFPSQIERSFVIGDELWTLSPDQLGVTDLASLTDTSFVDLG
jgi:hypothetical protein